MPWEDIGDVAQDDVVIELLGDPLELQDLLAEAACQRVDLDLAALLRAIARVEQGVGALDARLALCRAGLWPAPQPLELLLGELLPALLALLLLRDALGAVRGALGGRWRVTRLLMT